MLIFRANLDKTFLNLSAFKTGPDVTFTDRQGVKQKIVGFSLPGVLAWLLIKAEFNGPGYGNSLIDFSGLDVRSFACVKI